MSGNKTAVAAFRALLQGECDDDDSFDVTFIVGQEGSSKERIRCHKVFLMARSPVFNVMFSPRWTTTVNTRSNRKRFKAMEVPQQTGPKEIEVPDVSPKIFRLFLEFVYTDCWASRVAVEDVEELLYIADKYDMDILKCKLEQNMIDPYFSFHNLLRLHEISVKHKLSQLRNAAEDFMRSNFHLFALQDDFKDVDKNTLIFLVSSDRLRIAEINLFKALIKWANARLGKESATSTGEDLRAVLEPFIRFVRFPAMPPKTFAEEVIPTNILSQNEVLSVFVSFSGQKQPACDSVRTGIQFCSKRRPGDYSYPHDYMDDSDSDVTYYSENRQGGPPARCTCPRCH